jgi:hypothetical protein
MMWDIGRLILANPLARRYGMYALAALLLVGAVTAWRIQTAALRAERDGALQKQGSLEQEAAQLRSSLELARLTVEAQHKAEQDRVAVQQTIEVTRNERSKRNTATLDKAENKSLADMPLTADMLDGLRDQ